MAQGVLDWSAQGLPSDTPLPDPFIVQSGGRTLTITHDVETDGGLTTVLSDFVTFNAGTLSDTAGIGVLAFNNASIDLDDRIVFEMAFDEPVANLAFDIQDIDQGGSWDDGLVVLFDDGTGFQNLLGTPFATESGPAIIPDDESGFVGWEGAASSPGGATLANLEIDFGSQLVQAIRIEFFTADDAPGDPGSQFAGLSDITWVTAGADLSLSLSADDPTAGFGDPAALTLSVTNSGVLATSGVEISYPLGANLLHVSDTGGGDYDPATGVWTVPGTLAVGETRTLTISATVNTNNSFNSRAEVAASAIVDPDSTPGNAAADPFEDDTATVTFTPGFSGGLGGTAPPLSCGASAEQLDWAANPYPAGTLSQSYTVNGTPVAFTFSGDTAAFVPFGTGDSPGTGSGFTGGLTTEDSLLFAADYVDTSQSITLTIDLGDPGIGVDEAQFVIFDLDLIDGVFQDRVTLSGLLNGVSVGAPVLTASSANQAVGGVGQGLVSSGAGSGDGNITATFSQRVDQIVLVYDNGPAAPAAPGLQAIAVHDVDFCPILPGADLEAVKTTQVFDENVEGLYAIPGNDVTYTITVTNVGDGASDEDSIVLIDQLPSEVIFFNGDVDGASGSETANIAFADFGSGLTFDPVFDAGFSDAATRPADFAACTYAPQPGYDPAVTFICFNPKGVMAAGAPDPAFSVTFRARIR